MEGETVIAGVDTHKDVHVLCLLDGLGRKIWSGSFGADPEGYDRLAEAIGDPGSCMVVGVEGTASYGAGLTRRLVELVSVNIIFTISTNAFSPIAPTRIRRIRQRGYAGFANADVPLSAPRRPPPSRPHRRWTRPSGGTTGPLS